MYVLILYVIISLLMIYSLINKSEKMKKLGLVVFVLSMIFFCLRFPLGTDIDTYNIIYGEAVKDFGIALKGVPYPDNVGYNVFMSIAKNLNLNFNMYMLYFNIIIGFLLSYIVIKKSDNVLISLVILLGSGIIQSYYVGMLRQMIIMVIFVYAFYYCLANKKYVLYYLLTFVAISFQWIALILLFIPIAKVFYEKTNKYVKYLLPLVCTVVLFGLVSYVLPQYAYLVPGRFHQYLAADTFSLIGLLSRIAVFMTVLVPYYLCDKTKLTSFDKFSVYMCYLSLLLYIVFSPNAIFSRVSDMISIIEIILVPRLIMLIDKDKLKLMSSALLIGVNAIFLYTDTTYIARQSLQNKAISEYPLIWIWEDVAFDDLFNVEE